MLQSRSQSMSAADRKSVLFAQHEEGVYAGGAGCSVIHSGIKEGDPFGSMGEIAKERSFVR
jgi:hypothetical protein